MEDFNIWTLDSNKKKKPKQDNFDLNMPLLNDTPDFFGTNRKKEQPKKNSKRALGTRDREILWKRAKKKCENCDKKIDSGDMQVGHKLAASKGGKATYSNSVSLCYGCNKSQGTDSWKVFRKKQGKLETRTVTSGKKRSRTKKRSTKKPKTEVNIFGIPIKKNSWRF